MQACILLLCLAGTGLLPAAPGKPVALTGSSYGVGENTRIIRAILSATEERQYRFVNLGESLPAEDAYADYSLIIVSHGIDRPLSSAENESLRNYVYEGGSLLLIAGAHRALFGSLPAEDTDWTGISSSGWRRNGVQTKLLAPDNNWLQNAISKETAEPAWLKARFTAIPADDGMSPIVGTDNGESLVGRQQYGEGWVAFLGHEVFRMARKTEQEKSERKAWLQIIANIVDSTKPLREIDYRESLFDAVDSSAELWFWMREWQAGERYGPRFDPPLPRPEELVTEISADMALDEFELIQLNTTPLQDLGEARVTFASETFPPEKVQFFLQDCPDPIPWKKPELVFEAPYWLMPLEAVAPRGSPSFICAPRKTSILWIKLDSSGLSSGIHQGIFTLNFADQRSFSIPLTIRLFPVSLPRQRLITLAPAGTSYGNIRNVEPAMRFMRNLNDNGYQWSIFSGIRISDARIVGETGELTVKKVENLLPEIRTGTAPSLEFPTFADWIEQSIEHYLTNFKMGAFSHNLRAALTRRTSMSEEDIDTAELWFCRELSRYLREKGVRIMITTRGDELSRKEIMEWYLPWAQRMAAAGWGCSSSFTGKQHVDPEINRLLRPYVKLWTLNRGLPILFTEALKAGTVAMRPDAILGTYGAGEGRGTEIRKNLAQSRFLGWESWKLGVQNCSPNPYFKGWLYYIEYGKDRGLAGERFLAYLDIDDLDAPMLNSPFIEGIREGMEDGNLAAILDWYLENLPPSELVDSVRQRRENIMTQDETALLPYSISERRSGLRVMSIKPDNVRFRTAKREVLECLAALRPEAQSAIKPTLFWHDIPLVADGTPQAAIYAADMDVTELTDTIKHLCGCELPVLRDISERDSSYPVKIVVGNQTQNPLVKSMLSGTGTEDATETYPGAGRYFIREIPLEDTVQSRLLFVAGPDEEGTQKGLRLFSRFLHARGAWIR